MPERKLYTILWPNKDTGQTEQWDATPQQFVGFLRSMNVLEEIWTAMLQSRQENRDYWTTGGRNA